MPNHGETTRQDPAVSSLPVGSVKELLSEVSNRALFGRMMNAIAEEGCVYPLKHRPLSKSLGLKAFATTPVPALRFRVHGDPEVSDVWLASGGTVCVMLDVYFIGSGECSVLVPVTDPNIKISISTAQRIYWAVRV